MKKILGLTLACCLICFTGCGEKNDVDSLDNKVISMNNNESENISQNVVENDLPEENNDENVNVEDAGSTENNVTPAETLAPSPSIKSEVVKDTVLPNINDDGVTVLKFKNTNSDEAIKALNGKKVSITGYISTLSPLNGEFAYLMNMPYQSCPFCIPGTSEISNTLAIYAGNKSKIKFTDEPVTVVGTLETGDFTDGFGYQYGVRLNNVTVSKADVDKLSAAVKQYNLLAENGVVGQIYDSIMSADPSVFYNYYQLEKPELISMDFIKSTKSTLEGYNGKGEYNQLINTMDELINLCNSVNSDIESGDYSKFSSYQVGLQNVYYVFSMWMAEGEL